MTSNRIDEDLGREVELMLAKMQPYDGKIDYGQDNTGRAGFMGYELKPYRTYRPQKKAFAYGTRIIAHYKSFPPVKNEPQITSLGKTISIDNKEDERSAIKEAKVLDDRTNEYKNFWGIK